MPPGPAPAPPQDTRTQTPPLPLQLDLSTVLRTATASMFNNPCMSDVTLLCPDGRELHCHRVVLAAGSRRLAQAFTDGAPPPPPLPLRWNTDSFRRLPSACTMRRSTATSTSCVARALTPHVCGVTVHLA